MRQTDWLDGFDAAKNGQGQLALLTISHASDVAH